MTDDLLRRLGCDDAVRAEFASYECADAALARICRVDRGGADLLDAAGLVRATYGADVLCAMGKDRAATPAVGDWAVVRTWPDGRRTVHALLTRRSSIARLSSDSTSHEQPLAANVDYAVVVEPLLPAPEIGRIERLLVLAWSSGATPMVLLTKADLARDSEDWVRDVALAAPGVVVQAVSALTGAGLDELRAELALGRTVALLGPSGAGKSTLTNALAGATVMVTQEQRPDGKGRHTTTHRELVPLPLGGVVIDTPGLRSVGLVGDEDALAAAFDDVAALAELCRFRDCGHGNEPGCAITGAVENGDLDLRRLDSWRKLQREVRRQELRHDARKAAAQRSQWKSVSKDLRKLKLNRP